MWFRSLLEANLAFHKSSPFVRIDQNTRNLEALNNQNTRRKILRFIFLVIWSFMSFVIKFRKFKEKPEGLHVYGF